MKLTQMLLTLQFILLAPLAVAQQFNWAPGLPVGSTIPVLEAPDQNGKTMTLETLSGENGLVLLFNRSFNWCPWCKAQLVDLVGVADQIRALGFNVATLTYDPVATLKAVEEDQGVTFPLLHDEAVRHVQAYGILNTEYEPGHFAYGIPQPGIMVMDPKGTILLKFAEENYRERPDFAVVLDGLRAL
jgi:peroxiredoxin